MMIETYIGVSVETREDLKRIGKKGDTYDDVVAHLVLMYESAHGR